MKRVRRRFSREFKLEAVRQLTAGRRLADVARELGIEAQVMRRWVQQVAVDPGP
jgi:transposase